MVIRDVGLESFSVESPVPIQPGTEHQFQFTSHGLTATITGSVRRCERFSVGKGPRFIVGLDSAYKTLANRNVNGRLYPGLEGRRQCPFVPIRPINACVSLGTPPRCRAWRMLFL